MRYWKCIRGFGSVCEADHKKKEIKGVKLLGMDSSVMSKNGTRDSA